MCSVVLDVHLYAVARHEFTMKRGALDALGCATLHPINEATHDDFDGRDGFSHEGRFGPMESASETCEIVGPGSFRLARFDGLSGETPDSDSRYGVQKFSLSFWSGP